MKKKPTVDLHLKQSRHGGNNAKIGCNTSRVKVHQWFWTCMDFFRLSVQGRRCSCWGRGIGTLCKEVADHWQGAQGVSLCFTWFANFHWTWRCLFVCWCVVWVCFVFVCVFGLLCFSSENSAFNSRFILSNFQLLTDNVSYSIGNAGKRVALRCPFAKLVTYRSRYDNCIHVLLIHQSFYQGVVHNSIDNLVTLG